MKLLAVLAAVCVFAYAAAEEGKFNGIGNKGSNNGKNNKGSFNGNFNTGSDNGNNNGGSGNGNNNVGNNNGNNNGGSGNGNNNGGGNNGNNNGGSEPIEWQRFVPSGLRPDPSLPDGGDDGPIDEREPDSEEKTSALEVTEVEPTASPVEETEPPTEETEEETVEETEEEPTEETEETEEEPIEETEEEPSEEGEEGTDKEPSEEEEEGTDDSTEETTPVKPWNRYVWSPERLRQFLDRIFKNSLYGRFGRRNRWSSDYWRNRFNYQPDDKEDDDDDDDSDDKGYGYPSFYSRWYRPGGRFYWRNYLWNRGNDKDDN